jgi:phosphatidylglycerophosphatase A
MILRPTRAFAYSHPAHAIALGLGAGLARFAPGSFGTLVAWPLGWGLNGAHPALVFPLIAAAFVLGVWACGVTGRHLGIHDHGSMVWDEIVAFVLVVAVLPGALGWQLAGFVAFRAFDIVKPAPIRWIERRFHGGFGVMLDDLVAAGYALLVLALAHRLLFHG